MKFQPGQIVRHERVGVLKIIRPAQKSFLHPPSYYCKFVIPTEGYNPDWEYTSSEARLTPYFDILDVLKEML